MANSPLWHIIGEVDCSGIQLCWRDTINILRATALVSSLALLNLIAANAMAKDKPEWRSWPMGERLYGSIGYYRPKLSTKAAVSDEDGNLGALISFEDSLGLEDNKSTPIFSVAWRISKRNALSVNYFELDRSAQTDNSTISIFIPNDAPPPDSIETELTLPLSSFFNIESADITYTFSPIFTEKHNLGLGIGLALQTLEFGFQPTVDCNIPECDDFGEPRKAKATAPLPTLKMVYQYAITDKWIIDTSLGYFALELELDSNEDIGGSIWNAAASVRWKTWQHVGFDLGWKYFDVDADYQKRSLKAAADYKYSGLFFGINGYW